MSSKLSQLGRARLHAVETAVDELKNYKKLTTNSGVVNCDGVSCLLLRNWTSAPGLRASFKHPATPSSLRVTRSAL